MPPNYVLDDLKQLIYGRHRKRNRVLHTYLFWKIVLQSQNDVAGGYFWPIEE